MFPALLKIFIFWVSLSELRLILPAKRINDKTIDDEGEEDSENSARGSGVRGSRPRSGRSGLHKGNTHDTNNAGYFLARFQVLKARSVKMDVFWDDGGSKIVWNVGHFLPDNGAQHAKRQPAIFNVFLRSHDVV
jgi:hypothetical protein